MQTVQTHNIEQKEEKICPWKHCVIQRYIIENVCKSNESAFISLSE